MSNKVTSRIKFNILFRWIQSKEMMPLFEKIFRWSDENAKKNPIRTVFVENDDDDYIKNVRFVISKT